MTHRLTQPAAVLAVMIIVQAASAAEGSKLLFGFENEQELRVWEFQQKTAQLSDQHVTQGQKSLKITTGELMNLSRPADWSGYESLDMDIFLAGEQPVSASLVVGDKAWLEKSTYWNRHNSGMMLKPGANAISIPVTGMYRGEAGSRNNDLKSNIDPAEITRFYIQFATPRGGAKADLYIDNMRLVKSSRPVEVLAFDLGPSSQTVFPGFTPIGPDTVHGQKGNKAGLKSAVNPNAARDVTFPTRLYQDYVVLSDNEFIADVPDGQYSVWVVFENLGFWGGETARFRTRAISAEDQMADVEDRGDAGPSDYLFRFEKIEPRPGDSLWDIYLKHMVAPRRFQTQVRDGKLNLRFDGGSAMNTKVAAIVIHPADSQAAAAWVKDVEQKNREEFENRSVFMGPMPKELNVPATATEKGYWLGFPALEQTIAFADAPGSEDRKLHRIAAQNQKVSVTFAIRPLKEFAGPVELTASELKSGDSAIQPGSIDLRYVHHGTRRGFNSTAYQIMPETLRPVIGADLKLSKNLTRQFWVTVSIPADARPGVYNGQIAVKVGELRANVPYSVEVLDLMLDEPAYSMGFYGVALPADLPLGREDGYRRLLQILKDNGMNSFSGGPNLSFKGLDAAGKPIIENYDQVDAFFRIAREVGFNHEVSAYGGPGMVGGLHDGYVIGQTGRGWAQKTGKSFDELLKIVWTDVQQHAKEANWLPIAYGFTDEPRVLEQANEQLELMKAYRSAVPFVKIGGSYSVHFDKDTPLDKAIQDIFKTLVWSALNTHSQVEVDKAKELGRELWIYNQGLSRFSWGAYQWAEMRKGVAGRMQWHTLAMHGYQFFDLDGREPDTAAIMWGREQIYPTINLPRCREGADDFRLAVTLWNRAQKAKDTPEAQAALQWLQQIADAIPAGGRAAVPESLKDDEQFRATCAEHLKKLK